MKKILLFSLIIIGLLQAAAVGKEFKVISNSSPRPSSLKVYIQTPDNCTSVGIQCYFLYKDNNGVSQLHPVANVNLKPTGKNIPFEADYTHYAKDLFKGIGVESWQLHIDVDSYSSETTSERKTYPEWGSSGRSVEEYVVVDEGPWTWLEVSGGSISEDLSFKLHRKLNAKDVCLSLWVVRIDESAQGFMYNNYFWNSDPVSLELGTISPESPSCSFGSGGSMEFPNHPQSYKLVEGLVPKEELENFRQSVISDHGFDPLTSPDHFLAVAISSEGAGVIFPDPGGGGTGPIAKQAVEIGAKSSDSFMEWVVIGQ